MDTIQRLNIRIRTDRELDQAKTALMLLKRGNVVVQHVHIGHRGKTLPNHDAHNTRTLMTAVYAVLAEGGTIEISLKECPVLPLSDINHWNQHSPTPPRAGPLFFTGYIHSFPAEWDTTPASVASV